MQNSGFSTETLVELLDPALWRRALEQYASATHLAVQLFNSRGRSVIECLNPQPLWTLLRAGSAGVDGECVFSATDRHCRCLVDAFHSQTIIFVRDLAGLVHFAVPLFLEERVIGGLVAGQVFDYFPDALPLERVARDAGLAIQNVCDTARKAHPVAMATLQVYSDLLSTLATSILQGRYKDILAAVRAEELHTAMQATQSSLAEKEALLQEVHHRVKNNLQVISSLLGLKSLQIKDEGVVTMFEEMRQRVQSIAVIHESLYRAGSFAAIDFVANTRQLGESLLLFYGLHGRVRIEVLERGTVTVPIALAVPCSLLINELLSNALKHAFQGRQSGTILINISQKEQSYHMEVVDNGVGMPPDLEIGAPRSFGLQLVDLLASQLGGTININSDSGGTRVHVSFPRRAPG